MKQVRTIQKLVVCTIVFFTVMPSARADSNSSQQLAEREPIQDAVSKVCVLSGKVINSDTGEPVPYFYLRHLKSNGGLIEHLETDEKGRFQTTAAKGSQRYFRFDRSRRGTYIIDLNRQDNFVPFRGIVRKDMKDLIFMVKLWPVSELTGKVLNKTGGDISNASVYIHSDVPAVKTDSSGIFKIHVAPTDRDFNLFAISEDMNQAGLVHLKAGATAVTIHLEPTTSYKGQVIDTEGKPVRPFQFIVGLRLNGSNSDCLQRQLQADMDGTFTIDYLYPKASYQARCELIAQSVSMEAKQSILRNILPMKTLKLLSNSISTRFPEEFTIQMVHLLLKQKLWSLHAVFRHNIDVAEQSIAIRVVFSAIKISLTVRL